jgi:hypothetical protein
VAATRQPADLDLADVSSRNFLGSGSGAVEPTTICKSEGYLKINLPPASAASQQAETADMFWQFCMVILVSGGMVSLASADTRELYKASSYLGSVTSAAAVRIWQVSARRFIPGAWTDVVTYGLNRPLDKEVNCAV